jgi:hypothetical protein
MKNLHCPFSIFHFLFSISTRCARLPIRRKFFLRCSLLDAPIIEPTLELREANAGSGAIFHVEDLP